MLGHSAGQTQAFLGLEHAGSPEAAEGKVKLVHNTLQPAQQSDCSQTALRPSAP